MSEQLRIAVHMAGHDADCVAYKALGILRVLVSHKEITSPGLLQLATDIVAEMDAAKVVLDAAKSAYHAAQPAREHPIIEQCQDELLGRCEP